MGSLTYNLRIYKSSIKSIYPKTVSEGSILKKVRKAIFQGFTCPARHYTQLLSYCATRCQWEKHTVLPF
jgi:hypothetical protein